MKGRPGHIILVDTRHPVPDIIIIKEVVQAIAQVFKPELAQLVVLHTVDQLVAGRSVDILVNVLQPEARVIVHLGQGVPLRAGLSATSPRQNFVKASFLAFPRS
jgi:hypothetical protein